MPAGVGNTLAVAGSMPAAGKTQAAFDTELADAVAHCHFVHLLLVVANSRHQILTKAVVLLKRRGCCPLKKILMLLAQDHAPELSVKLVDHCSSAGRDNSPPLAGRNSEFLGPPKVQDHDKIAAREVPSSQCRY